MFRTVGLSGVASLLGVGVLIILVISIGAQRSAELEPFQPFVKSYVAAGNVETDESDPTSSGRVMPIRKSQDQDVTPVIDTDIFFALPPNLKPEKPDQIGTVLLLDYTTEDVAEYDNGAVGSVYHVHATLVNLKKNRIVAEEDFEGGDPPNFIRGRRRGSFGGGRKVYGPKPVRDVIAFLQKAVK